MNAEDSTMDPNSALQALLDGHYPDARGRFGDYGGRFVPETLVPAILRLEQGARQALSDSEFRQSLGAELRDFVGRPTPLTYARNLSAEWGIDLFLKREDLAHTGAHKINNALGQALLAKRLGAKRLVAETGAGQHGVASAAAAARVGLPCVVYMGAVDVERQAPNVDRIRRLGAEVVPVTSGEATLRAAIDEAIRQWVSDPVETFYLLGSVVGPHPYPWLVREFQKIIGIEARAQILDRTESLPDAVVACVGGGSNAIGLFHRFLGDSTVELVGVEAGGHGTGLGAHAATISHGRKGVLHGCLTLLLQNAHGQVQETASVSAGLDYAGVGPEHAFLADIGRVRYTAEQDESALSAFADLCRMEGIIPAVESSHALAGARRYAKTHPGATVIVGLSGRGDKDLPAMMRREQGEQQ